MRPTRNKIKGTRVTLYSGPYNIFKFFFALRRLQTNKKVWCKFKIEKKTIRLLPVTKMLEIVKPKFFYKFLFFINATKCL